MKEDKIALITEAGNGLSPKFALLLVKQGFRVVIAASKDSYQKLQNIELKNIDLIKIDLTQTEEITRLQDYIKSQYGNLTVLVNNAEMVNGFGQKITELDLTEIKQLYEVNLFSVINTTKILYNLINKSKNSSIINITSSMGNVKNMKDKNFGYSNYNITAYATAKSALDMLTVLLQNELRNSRIKVSSFDPIRIENCTHNDVTFCESVQKEFLALI